MNILHIILLTNYILGNRKDAEISLFSLQKANDILNDLNDIIEWICFLLGNILVFIKKLS